ncbi:MAG: tetratricopeptide repeat protein [Calditrichaeota bacterium]|nr:tetratricopeptide repeat protein [Calditrichota bacterium]
MKEWITLLSGNVPGGIGLYLLLLVTLLFIFYYFYRTSELFTGKHFRLWFLGSWLLLTLIYALIWIKHPPPQLLKRYSIVFFAERPQDRWLAYFFRDEVSDRTRPFESARSFFFPQRWFYLANFSQPLSDSLFYRLAEKIPIHRFVLGRIERNGRNTELVLQYYEDRGRRKVAENRLVINRLHPGEQLSPVMKWIHQFIPQYFFQMDQVIDDSLFALARDHFFRKQPEKAISLYQKSLKMLGIDDKRLKWVHYARIRYAEHLRALSGEKRNPFDFRERPWEKINRQARNRLLLMLRENTRMYVGDTYLNMMIAESFILEEKFGDAEVFLKSAYADNPFDVEILDNLSHLHPSRYKDLKFSGKNGILEKILIYCPLYEEILVEFVERLLKISPIHGEPPLKVRDYLQRYLALNPASPVAWNLLGKFYYLTFRNQEALRAFFKADSLDPGNALIQFNIGVVYHKLKELNKAEAYFKKAIAINDYLDAHLYLGEIYLERGEYEKALKEFRYRVAHKTGPDDEYALEAMKGIRKCLEALNIPIPEAGASDGNKASPRPE